MIPYIWSYFLTLVVYGPIFLFIWGLSILTALIMVGITATAPSDARNMKGPVCVLLWTTASIFMPHYAKKHHLIEKWWARWLLTLLSPASLATAALFFGSFIAIGAIDLPCKCHLLGKRLMRTSSTS